MLQHHTIPVTAFQQNCSIVWCDQTMEGAVIDPGGDVPRIRSAALRLGVMLRQILLTHAHIDHAGGVATLARELALPIVGPHPDDQFWISALPQQGRMFGLEAAESFTPTRWPHDGDSVQVGRSRLAVRHRPVIEKIFSHLGLEPQPPPKGWAREAGQDSSRLSHAGRHKHHAPGCSARPQPALRRATCQRGAIGIWVNPEGLTASAPCERPKDLPTPLDATARAPNPGTSGRRRPVLVLAKGP